MPSRHGLLRHLLGPASSHILDHGARHVPRTNLAEAETSPEEDLSGQQFAAMVHAVWLVFASDDTIDESETEHLLEIIDDLTEGEASMEAIEELFDAYATLYAEVGAPGSAALIADILREQDLRESTIKLAMGAATLDKRVSDSEERVLMLLASAFGYSSGKMQALFNEVEGSLHPRE